MQCLSILVLGPAGPPRAALEGRLHRLGHSAVGATLGEEGRYRARQELHDLVVADMRSLPLDGAPAVGDLEDIRRPLLVVTNEPRSAGAALGRRAGTVVLMSGHERDAGYEAALHLCVALGRPRIPQPA
jgi:DNA-binding response OmpR family regulator